MNAIAILDAGGQYCHLISRQIRELGVRTEVLPIDVDPDRLRPFGGIVISGGPRSVLEKDAPRIDERVLKLDIPVLGICYGHQLLAHTLDASSVASQAGSREYGPATLQRLVTDTIFKDVPKTSQVWMSHGDSVRKLPSGFEVFGSTDDCPVAAMGDLSRNLFGVQFHPEVHHTKYGKKILRNFVTKVCRCDTSSYDPKKPLAIKQLLRSIKGRVRDGQRVLFFISGGVDSAVAYRLTVEAIGADRVHGVFVDTGLLRLGEVDEVKQLFNDCGFQNIEVIPAANEFLRKVGTATAPEDKRKRIGAAFLDIENEVLRRFPRGQWLLGQGTIYPDTIESGGSRESALIKTHHNRVPELIVRIANGEVLEPLADFYKDEVRKIGKALGLPDTLVMKQPFPGPGLAVRCLCSDGDVPLHGVDTDKLRRIASQFGFEATALPIRAVGVQGDERSYAAVAVLEGSGGPIDWVTLGRASKAITNAIPNVNRVAYLVKARSSVKSWTAHEAYLDPQRLDRLRRADATARAVIATDKSASDVWQCPVVMVPTGARGTGREAIVLRPVRSVDGMTADFVHLEESTVLRVADAVLEDPSIEGVLCDVTNKPPATIEWE